MDILFLSHCTPYPPDKGERIRAYRELLGLSAAHSVHVVCFAKSEGEALAAQPVAAHCASLHVETMHGATSLAKGLARFAVGGSVTLAYYRSRRLAARVAELTAKVHPGVTLAYSSAMGQYAPAGVPLVADFVDVDSEKWRQYARLRQPGFVYGLEAGRLRRAEIALGERAACTVLCTEAELALYRSFAGGGRAVCIENGVDLEYFDPAAAPRLAALAGKRYAVFVGAMDYYPNRDAAEWFARDVLPLARRQAPDLEFYVVGRNPGPSVRSLAALAGVTVTGEVPDVRPYLRDAAVFVAPLRVARGIQNKVLEALAMAKPVVASREVAATFGGALPAGMTVADSAEAFAAALTSGETPAPEPIRQCASERFSWPANIERLREEVERAAS